MNNHAEILREYNDLVHYDLDRFYGEFMAIESGMLAKLAKLKETENYDKEEAAGFIFLLSESQPVKQKFKNLIARREHLRLLLESEKPAAAE